MSRVDKGIAFGPFSEMGMKPLGVKRVLDSCRLNMGSAWLTSRVLCQYGVLCPRQSMTVNLIETKIGAIKKMYPVVEGTTNMGVIVHESVNMRGFHVLGDDDDLAKLWIDFFEGKSGSRGFSFHDKAVCWTAMVPDSVYVPYVDLDEKGTSEADLHRVITERVQPTISAINGRFRTMGVASDPPSQIFFNWRKNADGTLKFSFHIHWYTLGFQSIAGFKNMLLSIVELPRRLAWEKSGVVWQVTEDLTKCLLDTTVYSGRKQLFRGPYCGKMGRADAVLRPVLLGVGQDTGKWRAFPDMSVSPVEFLLRARIATSRFTTAQQMISFSDSGVAPERTLTVPVPLPACERSANMQPFLLPLLLNFILPCWQNYRKSRLMSMKVGRGAVVPVDNIKLVKNIPHERKPGVRHLAVDGDTFCEMDDNHFHSSHNRRVIGIRIDFVNCVILQTCFACQKDSQKYYFLHNPNNEVRIETEQNSKFTCISHWGVESNIHQFLLDYYPDRFRYHRESAMVWVFDDETKCWRSGVAASMLAGKLIDKLNRLYCCYIQSKKHVIVQNQLTKFRYVDRPGADTEDVQKMKYEGKIFDEARKFVNAHKQIIKCTPAIRTNVVDAMRSYVVKREIEQFEPFPHLIPMRTGMCLNVFTNEVEEMTSEHFFTSVVDAEVIPLTNSDVKDVNDWFSEISTGDEEKAKYLKRVAGYMLTFLVHDRKFYTLKGNGKNGKGTFKQFLLNILKGPAGSEPRFKNLNQNFWEKRGLSSPESASPEAYDMMNKAVYYTDDMDRVGIDSCKVKRVVAAEPMSARTLWGKPITVIPRGKVLWSSNFIPDGPGNDNAYWERAILLIFLTKYVADKSKVNRLTFHFLQDETRMRSILDKKDAFFTIVTTALHVYYRTLPFDPNTGEPVSLTPIPVPKSVEAAGVEARETQFPLASFMREHTVESKHPLEYVTIEKLFQNYSTFLDNMNERKVRNETTQVAFVRLLSSALDINCSHTHVDQVKLSKPVVSLKDRTVHYVSGGDMEG